MIDAWKLETIGPPTALSRSPGDKVTTCRVLDRRSPTSTPAMPGRAAAAAMFGEMRVYDSVLKLRSISKPTMSARFIDGGKARLPLRIEEFAWRKASSCAIRASWVANLS